MFWGGGRNTQIIVMDPTNGHIVDVWMYLTNNGDYLTKFKKLYM